MQKNLKMTKKIIAMLMVFCMVFGMCPAPAGAAVIDELGDLFKTTATSAPAPKVTISDATAAPGGKAVVSVTMENVPSEYDGTWRYFWPQLSLPKGWTVAEYKAGSAVPFGDEMVYDLTGGGTWVVENNLQEAMSGEVLKLTLNVPADAAAGSHEIGLSNVYLMDGSMTPVFSGFEKVSGTVEVEESDSGEQPEPADLEFGLSVAGTPYDLYADGTYNTPSAWGLGEISALKVTVPAGTTTATFTCDHYGMDIWKLDLTQVGSDMTVDVSVSENGSEYLAIINSSDFYYVKIEVEESSVVEKQIVNVNVGSVEAEPGDSVYVPIGISTDVTDKFTKIVFKVTTDEGLTLGKVYMADGGNVKYKCTDMPAVGTITAKPRAATGEDVLPESIDDFIKVMITVPEDAADGTYSVQCEAEITWVGEPENVEIAYTNGKVTVAKAKYDVVVSDAENGTVTADLAKAAEGESVFVTVTPESGYILDTLTYTPEGGEAVNIKKTKSFTMPAVAVTIAATFKAAPEHITFMVSDIADPVQPGDEVTFAVTIENNLTNTMNYIDIGLAAPSCLTLKEVATGKDMPEGATAELSMGIRVKLKMKNKALPNGEVALLTYTVNENAVPGTYKMDFNIGDWSAMYSGFVNYSGTKSSESGSFTVAAPAPKVTISDATAAPGGNAVVTVSLDNPPAELDYQWARFATMFNLPDGWEIINVKEGADVDTSSALYVPDLIGAGSYGIDNMGYMNSVLSGKLLDVTVKVPADTTEGEYTIATHNTYLLNDSWNPVWKDSQFEKVSGTVTVEKIAEPTKLTAPALSTDNAVVDRTTVTVNVPASTEDPNATAYYAISTDGETYGEWKADGKFTGLSEGTDYYIKAYYKTADTVTFIDSDAVTLKVTTKVTVIGNAKITVSDISVYRGQKVEIPVYMENDFGDRTIKQLQTYFHVGDPNDETAVSIVDIKKGDACLETTRWAFLTTPQYNPETKSFVYNRIDADYVKAGQGEFYILVVEIAETAKDGEYTIIPGIQYNGSDEIHEFNWTFENGTVTVKPAMTAPVLTDAVANENMITVAPVPTVDGVKVEYAISSDNGESWSAWQESNVFENLTAETDYLVVARYVPEKTGTYDTSFASEPLKVRTVWPSVTATFGNATVKDGSAVVTLSLEHAITKKADSITIIPELPAGVTLKSAEAEGFTVTVVGGEINLFKAGNEAFDIPSGNLVTLNLSVSAEAGNYDVSAEKILFYNGTTEMGTHVAVNAGTLHVHKIVEIPAVEATCYGDGLTKGEKCSLCEEILKEQTVIETKGHVLKETVVPPTHNQKGYTLVECEACDYAEIKDFTEALDHKFVESVTKEATCTENGEMTFTCECGESYTQLIPKADHDCDATVTDATCESIGYTTYDCKNCDYSYVNDIKAALGHKETVVNAKEATHDDAGYTGDTVCSVCKDILKQGEKIAAWGCPAKDFSDVDTTKWYHDAVDYVLMNKLMTGIGNGLFAPNDNTTRAMMATLLYRMAGEPSVEGLENPFTDVKAGTWYTDAVIWAADKGVVSGTSATTFAPNDQITREQMVTMIWRYAGKPAGDVDVLAKYADADNVSDFAKEAMAWAISNGIVTGVGDNTLAPKNTATRAQIAAILMRYCEM